MEKNTRKDFVQKVGIIAIIILIIVIVALLILKYEVEGEIDMPFEISKIIMVSTAEGNQEYETDSNWEVDVYQNNDIYIDIIKNKKNKNSEIIKNIVINNFVVNELPKVGELIIYRPTKENTRAFDYLKQNIVNNEIIFTGSNKTNSKNLEIANQGGLILFRISNNLMEKYIANDEELIHDGSLIGKINKTKEDIKFKISFDITINLESEKSFKSTINLELPLGNIIENGTESLEKTDMRDVIFKRT